MTNTKTAARGKLPTRSIKARTEALLQRNLPYDEIVEKIREAFPKAKTTTKTVAWYASRMRADGQQLPERPRSANAA
jgi:hypothetical protein